jgi:hypothetical protein
MSVYEDMDESLLINLNNINIDLFRNECFAIKPAKVCLVISNMNKRVR